MDIPIAERLDEVRHRLAAAAARAGRDPAKIDLLAVSKKKTAAVVAEAVDAGHVLFGESRVQEAEAKIPELPGRLRWHFVGNLQSNKIRRALPLFEVIHSVGSIDLARDIDRIAAELGLFPQIFLQTNLAAESSKHGFAPAALEAALDELLGLERLQILGLMAIPPFRPDPEDSRADFTALRLFRDRLESLSGIPFPGLSMGMSHDFEVAIEEGATIVRVGSSIFGDRE